MHAACLICSRRPKATWILALAVSALIVPVTLVQELPPASKADGGPVFGQYPICDVAFESTLCFFDQQHVFLPDARPYGLTGRYSFDMIRPLDSSGNRNHAIGEVAAGPPRGSNGASALFRKSFIIIPHSKSFETTDYSVTFWLYWLDDEASREARSASPPLEKWCPGKRKTPDNIKNNMIAIHKGTQSKERLEAAPAILLDPNTGHLKVVVSTTATEAIQGEFFISNFRLRPHSWNHIAVVRHLNRLRLYVNGLLDSTMKSLGLSQISSSPFYVGGAPWSQDLCDVPFMMDELKLYSVPIGRDQVQAEAAGALAGMEASSLYFSCPDCTRLQAEEGCPEGFHLCTKLELMMGGYQVVRQLGLITAKVSHVFTGERSAEAMQLEGNSKEVEPTTGIGLCCHDSI